MDDAYVILWTVIIVSIFSAVLAAAIERIKVRKRHFKVVLDDLLRVICNKAKAKATNVEVIISVHQHFFAPLLPSYVVKLILDHREEHPHFPKSNKATQIMFNSLSLSRYEATIYSENGIVSHVYCDEGVKNIVKPMPKDYTSWLKFSQQVSDIFLDPINRSENLSVSEWFERSLKC